jgi:hypothetical protein
MIVSASCPSGQWQYGESCYKVVNTLTANWTNARDACSSQGGRLAVFDTRDKMQFIINLFRSGEHYFFNILNSELPLAHVAVSHGIISLNWPQMCRSSDSKN